MTAVWHWPSLGVCRWIDWGDWGECRYRLTPETIQSIFRMYPAVRRVYARTVPDKVSLSLDDDDAAGLRGLECGWQRSRWLTEDGM